MSEEWSLSPDLARMVLGRLQEVVDPCSVASVLPMSIVELGLIRDVRLRDGVLQVCLRLTSPSCMMVAYIAREVDDRLRGLPSVARVELLPDEGLDWEPEHMDPDAARRRRDRVALLHLGSAAPR